VRGLLACVPRLRSHARTLVLTTPVPGALHQPFIWRNADGIYHGIIHVGRPNTHGLHYYSLDGSSWVASTGFAYTSVLTFANGTTVNLACRERPHVVHDAAGRLVALTNGAAVHACHQAGADDHSVSFLQATNVSATARGKAGT
jgi:hypothetical protein